MNESKKIDPRELSPLALAFVGDSVLELLVRQRLAEHLSLIHISWPATGGCFWPGAPWWCSC